MPARSRNRKTSRATITTPSALPKVATGIDGFDEITGGGLPKGRPTLVCGGPGCGKTLFGLEFLIHGAAHGEPGVFVTFEETEDDLLKNVASLGYDLADLVKRKRLAIEYIRVERSEIEETGEYDLEGLFIRLDHALRSIGARRIVLDTIESLFAGLSNAGVLRAELRRLFAWLKDRGITAVITGERGADTLTRQGLEEYVSDCVIFARPSRHRSDFDAATAHRQVPGLEPRDERISVPDRSPRDRGAAGHLAATGPHGDVGADLDRPRLARRDVRRQGLFPGSSVLISGGAGTAKTSLAAHFMDAACRRGERALCFQFEESPAQYVRNMRSIGLDLDRWVKKGLLRIHAARPTLYGLEFHLATMHRDVDELEAVGRRRRSAVEFHRRHVRRSQQHGDAADRLSEGQNITALFTHLIPGSGDRRISRSASRR